jgi:hypothetical protein
MSSLTTLGNCFTGRKIKGIVTGASERVPMHYIPAAACGGAANVDQAIYFRQMRHFTSDFVGPLARINRQDATYPFGWTIAQLNPRASTHL